MSIPISILLFYAGGNVMKNPICQQQAAAIPDSIGFVVALSAIAGLWIGNWQVFLQSLQQMS